MHAHQAIKSLSVHTHELQQFKEVEIDSLYTVPLDLSFTYAHAQKATACNIHGNAPE